MKRKSIYAWIALLTTLLLLLILFGFLGIWVLYGSAANVMSLVGVQRARAEHMVKDVLVLEYRSSSTERTTAISELQDTLPLWEKTQQGLQVGDTSLGLPRHPPADVLLSVIQAQSDFVPMQVALQNILAHPTHIDPTQLQIVLDHERGYYVTMSQTNALWQQQIDEIFFQLFWIETGLVAAIAGIVVVNFVFVRRSLTTL